MTKKELVRVHVIKSLIEDKMTSRDAAEVLSLSERQIKRLKAGVKKDGEVFVIHKNRGRKPKHTIPGEIRDKIVFLTRNKYEGVNYTHLAELLREHEGISISQSFVSRILKAKGIKSPRKHRPPKPHRTRERKPQEGLLLQMDASPYEWIPGIKCSLHGAIDDARGNITGLYFSENECLDGYFAVKRQTILEYGIPMSIYVDQHTIFKAPSNTKLTIYDELEAKTFAYTQFGRAMQELSVGIVYARSPQAKGRIERLWETLQDRLTLELRLAGIKSIKEANAFLPGFIKRFNARFAVVPREPQSAYRPLEEHINIDYILCRKETRKASHGSTFSFGGQTYQLSKDNKVISIPNKAAITVLTSPRFGMRAEYKGGVYEVRKAIKPAKVIPKKDKVRRFIKVKDDHPWKNGSLEPNFTYEESDRELVAAIYDPKGWE
ncbi:MAG TPA: ISNCY family transposase [Candidatus Atribacteria bacterium]|nr:MAG: Integrase catalytic region [Atribacteria bacterium 34_128]HAJ33059.1 ISNCY family transposase [Candidatus Atribacteria bacterium]